MKDLFTMNGWSEVPKELKKCRELKHKLDKKEISRCYTEYSCPICQIKYKVDSSD